MAAITSEQWAAWHAFHQMRRHLDRALDVELERESSVSAPEYEAMIALSLAPDRQLRVGTLAANLAWEKSRVSHLIGRMEKRGLIERARCQTDARGAWVVLTIHGRRTLLAAMRGHNAALSQYFFDVLDDDEIAVFTTVSAKISAAISREITPSISEPIPQPGSA